MVRWMELPAGKLRAGWKHGSSNEDGPLPGQQTVGHFFSLCSHTVVGTLGSLLKRTLISSKRVSSPSTSLPPLVAKVLAMQE